MSAPKPSFGTALAGRNYGGGMAVSAPYPENRMDAYLGVSMWAFSGESYWGCPSATDKIVPGFYRPMNSPTRGPMLVRQPSETDSLLRLPCPTTEMLLAEFVTFWERCERLSERGLAVKRGLLLWGPPGSGKTSAVQLMAAHMIKEMEGVVVLAQEPDLTAICLHMLRQIEPTRPLIVVYEDIDAMVERYGESTYLAILDGELQVPGVVNVATTNYPERLDKRFADRPGRFDRIAFVGMPNAEARASYFKAKAPDVADAERERWVRKSDGWSIAHLRELVVAHLALGEDVDAVIERLSGMHEERPSSEREPGGQRLGFAA